MREEVQDTLMLRRLGIGEEWHQQLRTTNRTEHMNSRSKRWTVMVALDAERKLNRIVYQDQLDALKKALWKHVSSSQNTIKIGQECLAKNNQNWYYVSVRDLQGKIPENP